MAEQIRRDLAEIVREELKDPRIGLVSFTEVRLSRDVSHALVFCSVLDDASAKETIDTLNRASGFLRSQIASRLTSRVVPVFKFVLDDSMLRGAAMENLIKKARRADADSEAQAGRQADDQTSEADRDDASHD